MTFRPRTRVRFPWKLSIGRDCWIGEGVWFHNQAPITVGHDVVISQETMLTGSHAHRRDMALLTRPITIHPGAWIASRCVVTGGVTIGRSAVIASLTLVDRDVPSNVVRRAPWRIEPCSPKRTSRTTRREDHPRRGARITRRRAWRPAPGRDEPGEGAVRVRP